MQNIEINEQQLSAKLAEIADRINRRVSQTAYDVGQDLIGAKELCRHGEWLPFLEQAGINERNAQRMMRYVRLAGDVKDIQALPSMSRMLEKDRKKHEQKLEKAIKVIFEGVILVVDIFKSMLDKGDANAAIKMGCLIMSHIRPHMDEWFEEKDLQAKCDGLTHMAEGVQKALEFVKDNDLCDQLLANPDCLSHEFVTVQN